VVKWMNEIHGDESQEIEPLCAIRHNINFSEILMCFTRNYRIIANDMLSYNSVCVMCDDFS
jgi:hypothetical protein